MSLHWFQYHLVKLLKNNSNVRVCCELCPSDHPLVLVNQLRKHVSTTHHVQCHRSCHFCFGAKKWSKGDVKNNLDVSKHRFQCATRLLNISRSALPDTEPQFFPEQSSNEQDEDVEMSDAQTASQEPQKKLKRKWKRVRGQLLSIQRYENNFLSKLRESKRRETNLVAELNAYKEREANLVAEVNAYKERETQSVIATENLLSRRETSPSEESEKNLLSQLEANQRHVSELRQQLQTTQKSESELHYHLEESREQVSELKDQLESSRESEKKLRIQFKVNEKDLNDLREKLKKSQENKKTLLSQVMDTSKENNAELKASRLRESYLLDQFRICQEQADLRIKSLMENVEQLTKRNKELENELKCRIQKEQRRILENSTWK